MRIITAYVGRVLFILGLILLVPLVFALLNGETVTPLAFFYASVASWALGGVMHSFGTGKAPTPAQAMLVCTLSWCVISVAGAIPFVLAGGCGWIDGIFETMSGFTTTGMTIFSGLDSMPRSIILWRSLTQWVGGLGIITFFIAVISQVPGAHRLVGAESHKVFAGRPVPGLLNTVKILWIIYAGLTLALAAGFRLAGMNTFDTVNHAMTTLSTGGFSPHDLSMDWYRATGTGNYILIEYLAAAGMIAGGINFLVHYRVFRGEGPLALFRGSENRLWWILICGFTGVIMLEQLLSGTLSLEGLESTFRRDVFQVASVISTTGFSTVNLHDSFFGGAARQLFMVMMIIGGCAGSTGGGIKVLRVSVLLKAVANQVRKLFRAERAVSGTRYEGRLLPRGEVSRITAIVFVWLLFLLAGGVVTSIFEPDMKTIAAASGMFSALGNIGPSLMTQENLIALHPAVKITYTIGMLAGRLEILPVLLVFSRKAWR
ncbi:cation transporter [Candidatus Fermentibacteria bacterium]|nr:MAG: cation transporter [Candidatus Fermentibacteria bacterium]PIE52114.1 MAG: cation transporter [Candidatus Fermentibacteria bacterium]